MIIWKILGILKMFMILWRGIFVKGGNGIEICVLVYRGFKVLIRFKFWEF